MALEWVHRLCHIHFYSTEASVYTSVCILLSKPAWLHSEEKRCGVERPAVALGRWQVAEFTELHSEEHPIKFLQEPCPTQRHPFARRHAAL